MTVEWVSQGMEKALGEGHTEFYYDFCYHGQKEKGLKGDIFQDRYRVDFKKMTQQSLRRDLPPLRLWRVTSNGAPPPRRVPPAPTNPAPGQTDEAQQEENIDDQLEALRREREEIRRQRQYMEEDRKEKVKIKESIMETIKLLDKKMAQHLELEMPITMAEIRENEKMRQNEASSSKEAIGVNASANGDDKMETSKEKADTDDDSAFIIT